MEPRPPKPGETIKEKFPDMQPVDSPPSMYTLNGFGCRLYGKRDYDHETGTYIKTYCICALFIPLMALGAYRVADADEGWYFIGKERLSKFARGWNWTVLGLFLLMMVNVGISSYTSSPEYVARKQLKAAQADLQAGKLLKAANEFKRLANGVVVVREESKQGLRTALERALEDSSADVVAGGIRVLAGAGGNLNKPTPLISDPVKRGLALVEKFGTKDPENGLKLLGEVITLDPTNATFSLMRIEWLKRTVAAKPSNIERLVELALIYEGAKNLPECHKILMPQREKLGSTEGARILGKHLMAEGDYTSSYALLHPYVEVRLQKLHEIERDYTNSIASVNRHAIGDLRDGRAGKAFYDAYDKASKPDRERMVDDYLQKALERDGGYQRAVEQLKGANRIVNVALDLGIVQLNRAQELKDAAARKVELEAAEKTFLAIRGLAGETDEYRMFLGQVYYWLGRSSEGKELFDQLLAAKNRSPSILVALANTLRDVGDKGPARELAEEAYGSAKNNEEKYMAASMRALIQKDTEDRIAWLQKADPQDRHVQIEINGALGNKALADGDRRKAADHLRKAIAGYEALTKNTSSLNNCGLACLSLYAATGDIRDHNRGLALLEEAVALEPGNSILLINTSHNLTARAVMDVVGNSLRIEQLGDGPSLGMLSALYQDEKEQAEIFQRLAENESMKKGLTYLEKAMLLAPKEDDLYVQQLQFLEGFRDMAGLQKLQQRLQAAQLSLTEDKKEAREFYQGKKDAEYMEKFKSQISRLEKVLLIPEVKQHPATCQFALNHLNSVRMSAMSFGFKVDAQKVLADADEAYRLHPCSGSRNDLLSAHYLRLDQALTDENQEYAALAGQTRRSLSARDRVALVIDRGGALSAAVRRHPDFLKAVEIEIDIGRRHRTLPSVERWAILRQVNAEEARIIGEAIKASEFVQLSDQLEYQLRPAAASTLLDVYWMHRLMGREAKAVEIYQAAISEGVPLPPL